MTQGIEWVVLVTDHYQRSIRFYRDELGFTVTREVSATQAWGQRTAYFGDPDGHLWEIQEWIKF